MKKITLRNLANSILILIQKKHSFKDKIELFRVLLSVFFKSKFFKKNNEISQRIFDFKVTAHSYYTFNHLFREIFLANEYYFDFPTSSPKIIDCGANIGMALLAFKKMYPNSFISAFEPDPHTFTLLEKNVTLNNLTNVRLFNVGLSHNIGETDFFISKNRRTLTGSMIKARGGNHKIIVQSQKLSSFIGSAEFDLIKIDIEGAEIFVIEDLVAEGKLNQSERYFIEYHHRINRDKSNLSKFIKCFEDNHFEYNIRSDFSKIGSFQNIFLDFHRDNDIVN